MLQCQRCTLKVYKSKCKVNLEYAVAKRELSWNLALIKLWLRASLSCGYVETALQVRFDLAVATFQLHHEPTQRKLVTHPSPYHPAFCRPLASETWTIVIRTFVSPLVERNAESVKRRERQQGKAKAGREAATRMCIGRRWGGGPDEGAEKIMMLSGVGDCSCVT